MKFDLQNVSHVFSALCFCLAVANVIAALYIMALNRQVREGLRLLDEANEFIRDVGKHISISSTSPDDSGTVTVTYPDKGVSYDCMLTNERGWAAVVWCPHYADFQKKEKSK
jgi:hypothetical protein